MTQNATRHPTNPSVSAALGAGTLCEAFQLTAAANPDAIALRTLGCDADITWAQYADRVRTIASGLHALGVRRGDTVAVMLRNRAEFNLVDTAALHLGATPFSVYNTSAPPQIAHILGNARSRVVVTEPEFLEALGRAETPGVEHVICVDEHPGAMSLADIEASGAADFDLDEHWQAVMPSDLLTLVYTSGTTGPSKGVELTHGNVLASLRASVSLFDLGPGVRAVSYLPTAHIADRWNTHYYCSIIHGGLVTSVPDAQRLVPALPEIRPTFWFAVPRIFEKLKDALESKGITDPRGLSEQARTAVRADLGVDEVEVLLSGGAAISRDILDYFAALDLEIREVWGMSELAAPGAVNPRGRTKSGTVGTPIPGMQTRLAPDGELLCRGPIVMRGYRDNPEQTAEAIDHEGWLHTGDIVTVDDEGYLTLVDRKKEMIVNSAGKNMSPANIEGEVAGASPLIAQAVCIGNSRPYNVALVILDPDACAAWAVEHGLGDCGVAALASDPSVLSEIERSVAAANARLSRVEQIKRFAILPTAWQPGGDELTPTQKLKRRPIDEKYAAEIDALYGS